MSDRNTDSTAWAISTYKCGHNILILLDILPKQFSLQGNRNMVISNKNGIYELSYELPNKVRCSILRNYEIQGKFQNCMEL